MIYRWGVGPLLPLIANPKLTIVNGDVTDEEAVKKVDQFPGFSKYCWGKRL